MLYIAFIFIIVAVLAGCAEQRSPDEYVGSTSGTVQIPAKLESAGEGKQQEPPAVEQADQGTDPAQEQAAEQESDQEPRQEQGTEKETESVVEADSDSEPVIYTATLGAIGDVLIHRPIYREAEQKDGTYDFSSVFAEVSGMMQQPDLLIANEETMIGGAGIGLSTYPRFNSPHEVGDALKEAGVDFVTLANNHTLDRGEKAIQSALKYWDKLHMPYTGAYKNAKDQERIRTIDRNGITFAVLAYTYGTNGIPVPEGKDYLVNLIDIGSISADVKRAKEMADVVVVSMHWGKEYENLPNKEQQTLAKQLANMGVDIVIGNHPHVLQPPAWVEGQGGHKTFVFYSLGNFVSSQDGLKKRIGGIGLVDVVKKMEGGRTTIRIENPAFMPTYMYYNNWKNYRIVPMELATAAELSQSKQNFKSTMNHMQSYIPDLSLIHAE
ncbi:CapA family protein [Paenibacillus kobensis]|uniref:CapA family protein n=1 Tax=Paenibacillus kobensis TaxID=59841 RepID=UPI000FD96763|nr:CapA family protein [Paenibacillus kobensis]